MPTFGWTCQKCKKEFERFHDPNLYVMYCPDCGSGDCKREIGAGGGVLFKGSGFYATTYRSESYIEGAQKQCSQKPTPPSTSPEA